MSTRGRHSPSTHWGHQKKAEHADGSASADAVAAELADYTALARQEAPGLEGLGGFDITLVDEGETLVRQLRDRPTTPTSPENTRRALDIRNRVATLLVDKMTLVRAAARFVFRNQPEIVRLSTSAFERRRRRAQRAKEEVAPVGVELDPHRTTPFSVVRLR